MKEATGELNMTVITVIAISAVVALFYGLVWPSIQTSIQKNTCESSGGTWTTDANGNGTCSQS